MLELVQIPLAWSLARRLRERLQEREALLQHTLEACEVERRQIASDLHDGVVQDLAGVAYALSAAARRGRAAEADATVVEDSAETVRDSIRSSALADRRPLPAEPREEGLESALTDLLARARDRGLDVELDTTGSTARAARRQARLLYRAAQEALRNTLHHADARRGAGRRVARRRRARARGRPTTAGASTPTSSPQRGAEGHVGLRCSRGLVADAGGRLDVDSAPGRGTTLRVEVPLSMIRVLVADDHAVVRSGLSSCSSTADDIELVGTAANGESRRSNRAGRATRRRADGPVDAGARRHRGAPGGSWPPTPARTSWCSRRSPTTAGSSTR